MSFDEQRISKFLSLLLRHQPELGNLTLDDQGWVAVEAVLAALRDHGRGINRAQLFQVVANNDKQRFAISSDGERIRANQGHSITIDLQLRSQIPPDQLFHGTVERFLDSIFQSGLKPGNRHHAHLSSELTTALNVGGRRGKPVILQVDAKQMVADGHTFFLSENGVWLVASVPPQYLTRLNP